MADRISGGRRIVIVSNRGPLSLSLDDTGALSARRGAGGLVAGLGPLIADTDATWIAAALSDADRAAAHRGTLELEGFRVRLLSFDQGLFRMAYDNVCNATLWFMHHGLWDLSRRPRFDTRWREAWDAYREVNLVFAEAVAQEAPLDAAVLVQDYHLCLLAPVLREQRPDLRLAHFSHTPFAGPDLVRVLPGEVARELLEGLAAHHVCGFHTRRWAHGFSSSCQELLGRVPPTLVSPLAPNHDDIAAVADSDACSTALSELDAEIGDRALVVRVDRIELSKNILRGFHAFDDLLERHPRWRDRVVFGAFCYPTREGLPEYLAYRQEVESLVTRLNDKWGTEGWQPILFDPTDDFARSVAALRRYDVLLVNPIRDGLNLVALEGPLANERNGLLALSTEAGVFATLEGAVRAVNPFDVSGTADVLEGALSATQEQRAAEAAELARRVRTRTPADWINEQLAALG